MQARSSLSTEQQLAGSTAHSLDVLTCHIGILQQIQRVLNCAGLPEATLADIVSFTTELQQEYSLTTPVEDMIQAMVSRHLLLQYQLHRQATKKLAA